MFLKIVTRYILLLIFTYPHQQHIDAYKLLGAEVFAQGPDSRFIAGFVVCNKPAFHAYMIHHYGNFVDVISCYLLHACPLSLLCVDGTAC
jgi:hypothetical protein